MSGSPIGRPTVPDNLDVALSPEWLTAALATRFPGIRVTDVSPGPVVSRLSTNARFQIQCADATPPGLPEHLCVKGYFTEHGRSAAHAGVAETKFYRDLAEITGVQTLPSFYADVDDETQASVVITEDVVAGGATFLDPLSPYSPDQTALSLEELAQLHAATWLGSPYADVKWLNPWLPMLALAGAETIESNFGGSIGAGVPESVRQPQQLIDAYKSVAGRAANASSWSVIHGDAHVGNVFLARDRRPALVDWQLVQRGPWFIDVGYHIATTLTVEDRRRSERDLVQHYLDHLTKKGIEVPAESVVRNGIQQGLVHGFFLWAITHYVDAPITTELLTRLGTAVEDHGGLGLPGA